MVIETIGALILCAFLTLAGADMAYDSYKRNHHVAITTACAGFALTWLFIGVLILITHIQWVFG